MISPSDSGHIRAEARLAKRNRRQRLSYLAEPLEPRLLLSAAATSLASQLATAIRSINEVGNNVANPTWGTAGTDLLRLSPDGYADGIDSPSLAGDQSARTISNILNNQANPNDPTQDLNTVDQNSLSDFGYAFGQFMDHDLDNTPDGGAEFDIAVDPSDPIGGNLPFTRSITDPATGTSTSNPAQQITVVTSYLDLSQIYGSTQDVADALRTFSGGLLKTSPGNMLPYDNSTYFAPDQIAALNMANDAQQVPENQLFAAGDSRANENLELTTLTTLFVRNHNRIATELQKLHPHWGDQQLYDEARKLNIAEYQEIVYTGWIPAVLGQNALSKYTGYKANVNPSIATEFSTVAYRFGHSLVSPTIERLNNNGTDIASVNPGGSDISLAQDFFDPNLLNPSGVVDPLTDQTSSDIGPILKGEASGLGEAMDMMAVSAIRNELFGNGLGGDDLMARDVQRGRDDGIADYNTVREAFGLAPVTSFAQITSNVQVQQELAAAYPGGVNTIDAFEGGLAEDHVAGSDVGPLFQAIMVNQFTRLRDGDRFFYLNENFTPEEKGIMNQGGSLTKVIEDNTNVTGLQANAFIFEASIGGTVSQLGHGRPGFVRQVAIGVAGITVQLMDDDGNVVGTTTTNRLGQYSFGTPKVPGAAAGMSGTGDYTVQLVLPEGTKIVSGAGTADVAQSGVNLSNVDFVVSANPTNSPGQDIPPNHRPGRGFMI